MNKVNVYNVNAVHLEYDRLSHLSEVNLVLWIIHRKENCAKISSAEAVRRCHLLHILFIQMSFKMYGNCLDPAQFALTDFGLKWSATCGYQLCDILTSIDSDEPV